MTNVDDQKASPTSEAEPMSDRRRKWGALTILVGISISVLDASMTNVALPPIARDLNQSAAAVVWIVNAYGLTVAMTLLPLSAIGERIGFKRMFRVGLIVFTTASVASALAPSLTVLLCCRVLQGLGAAAIMCLFGALIRHIYTPNSIARGIGLNAMTVGVMSVLGPTLGSFILSIANWHWIFAINLPIGLLALFGVRSLPDVARVRAPLDWVAALLSMITVGLFIVGADYLATYPLPSLCLVAAGCASCVVLVRRSSGQTAPLVPVDLFRIPAMRFALAASASTFAAQMATFVSLPFYLQQTLHRPQASVGILLAGWPLGAALIALVAGRMSNRYPVALLCGVGAGAMASGLLIIVLLPTDVSDACLIAAMTLAGIGFGFFQTPNNRVLIGSAPRHRAGALGGIQATTRVFGQTFGAAVVASAFSLSAGWGPMMGLWVAITFATLAVTVNVVRYRQSFGATTQG